MESHIRGLIALGEPKESYGSLLVRIIWGNCHQKQERIWLEQTPKLHGHRMNYRRAYWQKLVCWNQVCRWNILQRIQPV